MFKIISRYFWIAAIVVTCINCAIFKFRSRRYVKENPDLEQGYATLLRGFLIWLNVPWVVMAIGCTFGGVPSVFHYFRPQDGNPYVLAWFASLFLLWALGTYWLFLRDGAEMLIKHPGALRGNITSPAIVKLLWLVCIGGGIFAVIMMWKMNMPMPFFR